MKDKLLVVAALSRRNLALFLKDRATVFFSLLAPIIILVLYVLFLGNVQTESILSSIPEGVEVSERAVRGFVDSWMLSGVVSVSCLTVALNSMLIMVNDKKTGIVNDYMTAPVTPATITLSYFVSFFLITVTLSLAVYALSLLYLAAAGTFFLSVQNVLEGVLVLLLSCLSATLIMLFIMSFFRSTDAVGAFSGIFSAAVGFLIGAYMPVSIMPLAVQYVTDIIPGTYSAGLFRNVFMSGALENLTAGMPAEFGRELADELAGVFSLRINFFGTEVGTGVMYAVLAVSVALFLAANLLVHRFRKAK